MLNKCIRSTVGVVMIMHFLDPGPQSVPRVRKLVINEKSVSTVVYFFGKLPYIMY
jgi:hypothetical protein